MQNCESCSHLFADNEGAITMINGAVYEVQVRRRVKQLLDCYKDISDKGTIFRVTYATLLKVIEDEGYDWTELSDSELERISDRLEERLKAVWKAYAKNVMHRELSRLKKGVRQTDAVGQSRNHSDYSNPRRELHV
jgi:hypothetical protein